MGREKHNTWQDSAENRETRSTQSLCNYVNTLGAAMGTEPKRS